MPRVWNAPPTAPHSGLGFDAGGLANLRGFRFIKQLFPVAAFLDAGAHGADFSFLLDGEFGAAFRTGLGDRHIRRGKVAVRVPRASVKDARAPTAACAAAADELALVTLWAFDTHGDWARVLALGISRTADELAEAAMLLDQAVAAGRALFIERLIRLARDARAFHQPPRGLAVGIAGASEKHAEAAALDGHLFAAVFAIFGFVFGVGLFAELGRKVLDKIAIRVARAAQKKSM